MIKEDDSFGSNTSISPDKHIQYSIKSIVPKFRMQSSGLPSDNHHNHESCEVTINSLEKEMDQL